MISFRLATFRGHKWEKIKRNGILKKKQWVCMKLRELDLVNWNKIQDTTSLICMTQATLLKVVLILNGKQKELRIHLSQFITYLLYQADEFTLLDQFSKISLTWNSQTAQQLAMITILKPTKLQVQGQFKLHTTLISKWEKNSKIYPIYQ